MKKNSNENLLKFASNLTTQARSVKRYVGNPHVKGDNVAEHIAIGLRYILFLLPELQTEFPNIPNFGQDLFKTFLIHDDDEIIDKKDIATFIKKHNVKDESEIDKFEQLFINKLESTSSQELVTLFRSFRAKSTVVAKVAKVVDNLVGNQLAIEFKIGLVNPHYYLLCVDYVKKYLGVSKIMDREIEQQIKDMKDIRENFITEKYYEDYTRKFSLAGFKSEESTVKFIKKLLSTDLNQIKQPDSKIAYTAVWEL